MVLTAEQFSAISYLALWAHRYDVSVSLLDYDDSGLCSFRCPRYQTFDADSLTSLLVLFPKCKIEADGDNLLVSGLEK